MLSNKIWIVGYGDSYKEKFDLFIKSEFNPEEIVKYIKTPSYFKCYFKNGDYLYGSNFNTDNYRVRNFDAIFIDKYVYWNFLTKEDREYLSYVVIDNRYIFLV